MTHEQQESLIRVVKNHPELYNTTSEEYKGTKCKDEIWAEVAAECSIKNAATAKKIWKNLRDSYRESLKRLKFRSKRGQDTSGAKKWKFHDQMAYVRKFMSYSIRKPQYGRYSRKEKIQDVSEPVILNDDDPLGTSKKKKKPSNNSEMLQPTSVRENHRRNVEQKTYRNEFAEQSAISSKPADSALYNFFMSMYETTLTFPRHYQAQIKREVFTIINDYEEKIDHSPSSSSISKCATPDFTTKVELA